MFSLTDCQHILGGIKLVNIRPTQVVLITCAEYLSRCSHQGQMPVKSERRHEAFGAADSITLTSREGSHLSLDGK